MTAISRKEKAIAAVVASSHRDLLTDRELISSQLKSRRPQLLPRRPIFWCCDAWMDETSPASDLQKLLQCLLQRGEKPRRRSWQAHENIAIPAQQESVQSGIWIYFQFRNRKEEMKYYKESGNSPNKHISHGRPVAGGGAGGARAPPEISRLDLNSATKVEFFY